MNRIETLLITGSNGFIGQSFLHYLSKIPTDILPKEIVLVNRKPPPNSNLEILDNCKISYVKADLTKPWDFNQKISHVLNLAGDGSIDAYSKDSAKNFIKICENLSKWASRNKPKVVVHASSGACYYSDVLDRTYESKKYLIESRKKGEVILENLSQDLGINVLSARLFTFIGPNILNKLQYAASSFVRNAIDNDLIVVSGNPSSVRSYMHETTMSEWLYKCLVVNKPEGIISIGSSVPVTIQELAEFISSKTNADIKFDNKMGKPSIYLPQLEHELNYLSVTEGPKWQVSVDECISIYRKKR